MTEREGGKSRSPLLFILVIFLLTIPFFLVRQRTEYFNRDIEKFRGRPESKFRGPKAQGWAQIGRRGYNGVSE
jgi:hypothetical protein